MRDRENGSPTGKGLEGSQRTGCHDGAVGWPGESVCSRGKEEAGTGVGPRSASWGGGERGGVRGRHVVKFQDES